MIKKNILVIVFLSIILSACGNSGNNISNQKSAEQDAMDKLSVQIKKNTANFIKKNGIKKLLTYGNGVWGTNIISSYTFLENGIFLIGDMRHPNFSKVTKFWKVEKGILYINSDNKKFMRMKVEPDQPSGFSEIESLKKCKFSVLLTSVKTNKYKNPIIVIPIYKLKK